MEIPSNGLDAVPDWVWQQVGCGGLRVKNYIKNGRE